MRRLMAARVLLLFVASLLLVTTLTSVLAPRELRRGTGAAALSAWAADPGPAAGAPREITVKLPRSAPIGARVGDAVTLVVRSEQDDQVRVEDLGYDAPVGPDTPAKLLVLANEPGSYPITLAYSGRWIGTLNVHPQ